MNTQPSQSIDVITTPQAFGVSADMLLRLDGAPTYRHLAYLDLMPGSPAVSDNELLPDAVVETNGNAAIYLIADNPSRKLMSGAGTELTLLRETLACRGDAHYLGVLSPGVLNIFPLGLYEKTPPGSLRRLDMRPGTELHDFLAGLNDTRTADEAWLDNYLLELLRGTARALKESGALSDGQVLSLVGRGLFARFIVDRHIVREEDTAAISKHARSLEALFDTPDAAGAGFAWLDKTFNGNLLPLLDDGKHSAQDYREFFSAIGSRAADTVCRELGNIMRRAAHGQLPMKWQKIRFAHVPADTLSQVYEHFAHTYWRDFASTTSIHYTPRHIAQVLVDSAFAGLALPDPSRARVLDPAVGAGVFLVLAFKRLVRERWLAEGARPRRETIRDILETQLCGLDLNAEALKFAALSLYLTALELDPSPTPLNELRFKALDRCGTLVDVGRDGQVLADPKTGKTTNLGSLSTSLPQIEQRRFDIVVGNPPWTELGQRAATELTSLVRGIARRQGLDEATIDQLQVNKGIPDIPFVWRAIEWAKENGMIAFALHAQHLLFQQGARAHLRNVLLECIELTGVLNGSAMRNSGVWPTVTAPFCFLLARNRKPGPHSAFYYLSPVAEDTMNREGRMRLDPHAAVPVGQRVARSFRFAFKTLAKGSSLDYDIVRKMVEHPRARGLAAYWLAMNLQHCEGFQIGKKRKHDASHLRFKKMLETRDPVDYEVDIARLRDFAYADEGLYRAHNPEIYLPPLVLFRKSPKLARTRRGGLLARGEVVYSESFIGYSAAGHPDGEALVRYLQLASYSDLFLYFLLMTSSSFGIERDASVKGEIDAFPLVPLDALSDGQRTRMLALSASLVAGSEPWDDIDAFFAELFDLTSTDLQVVRDTLDTGLPYTETVSRALRAPDTKAIEGFAAEVERIVSPFARQTGDAFFARAEPSLEVPGWRFVRIGLGNATPAVANDLAIARLANAMAERFWASQVRCHFAPDRSELVVGQIDQHRYWTKTRARLLALDLLNSGLSFLGSAGARH